MVDIPSFVNDIPIARALGYGKTKYKGYTQTGSTGNANGVTRLGNENQYNAYNNAMKYLNNYQAGQNTNWNPVGGSTVGYDEYKTKKIGGNKYKKVPVYSANLNTGYNVLDDFSNSVGYAGSALNAGWDNWKNREADIYQGRMDYLGNQAKQDSGLPTNSSLLELANTVNNSKYEAAKNNLYRHLVMGYMNNAQYDEALKELNRDRTRNLMGMLDVGRNQVNTWKDDIGQAWNSGISSNPDDWIKYYGNYDAGASFDNAQGNVDRYRNAFVSDDLLRAMMSDVNMYQPYNYMTQGIGRVSSPIANSLNGWYTGKRKAIPVYEEF